ncbi:short chain dehydrogenase [Pusillimonas sp. T7-7]|uniref:SDR family NAD(P)-dependent oxidoreductase n=1 Tax=Pusillimonas sp. (strain T7-7) TaxID=1007105 RepID=UPI00020855C8|nr:SDR family NAD(P)-dependent oxidoreductase [Pusillimonas sp. T7-7]AEC21976.1 short chain dehydrogenase [Pusillimonas sp. T7-7]
MPFSLQGKTVLITGAAGGIGSETARVCAELGASLVLADLQEPVNIAEELSTGGTAVQAVAFDVRDRQASEDLVQKLPQLDVIVANAGFCPWDDWNEPGWDDVFHQTIDINALGVINLLRPGLNRMIAQGSGRMVLVSSVAGRMGGLRASPHYVVAKGGINAMVKWLARQAAPHGITVNAVAPGATATNMVHGQVFDEQAIPLRRMATPREIAMPVAFLCSDAASYICGTILDVNGGVYMN